MLGETELAYVRCMPKHRMGDLIPTALGERLLSSEVHHDSLQLELRGPEGRAIATEWIDVRDATVLARLGREIAESYDAVEEDDPEILAAVEHDLAILDEMFDEEPRDFWDEYRSDGDRAWIESAPHYQIQVRLLHDDAIP